MVTLLRLRKTFHQAIAGALAAGCGPGPGIESDPDFVPVPCVGGTQQWLSDLKPEPAVDFMELTQPALTEGVPCRSASDEPACRTALEALHQDDAAAPGMVPLSSTGFRIFSGVDHAQEARLFVTAGDRVSLVDTNDELRAFLAAIDTPLEAMLLAQAAGYNVECKGGGARPADDGYEVQAYHGVGCDGDDRYLIAVRADGSVEKLDRTRLKDPDRNCQVGRRPAGLGAARQPRCATAGDYLAHAARLEAASVAAFQQLARELRAHSAPRRLVRDALSAAQDEVRHARATGAWARVLGGQVQPVAVDELPARELEAIALENAAEGCVRETFGALEASWQSLRAAAPGLRKLYARIAEDELRHAALAWRVNRWIEPRLTRAAQRRVRDTRQATVAELRRSLRQDYPAAVHQLCGVPTAREAHALFATLSRELA